MPLKVQDKAVKMVSLMSKNLERQAKDCHGGRSLKSFDICSAPSIYMVFEKYLLKK